MDRRAAARRGARGGEGIPASRATLTAVTLGAGAVLLAAALATWLALVAGPGSVWPVAGLAATAAIGLAVTLVPGRSEPVVGALALFGAAYAMILVVDDPPLDARSAIVGAAMLTIGELAHRSIEARTTVTEEAGGTARRVGQIALLALIALGLGALIVAAADLSHTGGLTIEVVGIAAAAGVVGLLVLAARDAGRQDAES